MVILLKRPDVFKKYIYQRENFLISIRERDFENENEKLRHVSNQTTKGSPNNLNDHSTLTATTMGLPKT